MNVIGGAVTETETGSMKGTGSVSWTGTALVAAAGAGSAAFHLQNQSRGTGEAGPGQHGKNKAGYQLNKRQCVCHRAPEIAQCLHALIGDGWQHQVCQLCLSLVCLAALCMLLLLMLPSRCVRSWL